MKKIGLLTLALLFVASVAFAAEGFGPWDYTNNKEYWNFTSGSIVPGTDDNVSIGTATHEVKDLYITGTANIDSLVADTADIDGGTIDSATIGGSTAAAGTFTTLIGSSVTGSSSVAVPEKTPVNAVASVGTITMSGVATADETFVIDTQTFTWKSTRSATGEVAIGGTADEAVTNIITAVTADLTTVTAADGTGSTVVVTAATKGTAANSKTFTESSTNMAVDGSGTLGGTTAGVDGTTGVANEIACDGSYLYHCVDTNTVSDDNWRRVSLGSAY